MTDDARSLHVTWDDPLPPARAAREMSGLDYLRKIAKGELPPPPIARLLDLQLAELGEGRAVPRPRSRESVSPSPFFW